MSGFTAAQLNEQQLFELTAYLRTQSHNFAPKIEFVADPDGKVISSERQKFRIEVLARGLEIPWGMAFLPDHRLLLTERGGHIRIYGNGKLSEPVRDTPTPHVQQDGGFLDISVHPQYSRNGWIYLAYSGRIAGLCAACCRHRPHAKSKWRRTRTTGSLEYSHRAWKNTQNAQNQWTEQQDLIFLIPPACLSILHRGEHYGCRFRGSAGPSLLTLGERGAMQNAQDLVDNSLGKIHRINDDGSVPKDNPFVNREGVDKTIWSYGHRNPEGLAWDPVPPGDFGNRSMVPPAATRWQHIQPGHNYGWGVISKLSNPVLRNGPMKAWSRPVVYFTPAIAPAGISFFHTGEKIPWLEDAVTVRLRPQGPATEASGNQRR